MTSRSRSLLSTLFVLAVALVIAVPAGADDDEGDAVSTVTVGDRTIEVRGGSNTSVVSQDGVVTIKSGGHDIRIEGNRMEVDGAECTVPEFKKLAIRLKGRKLAATVDGEPLQALLELAGALEETEAGAPPKEDSFPVADVKAVVLRGLRRDFRVDVDPKAETLRVERRGSEKELANLGVALEEGTLTIAGKGGLAGRHPVVRVVTPPGLAWTVDGCNDGRMGDVDGDLDVKSMGSGSLTFGKVRSARVSVVGSGAVDITEVRAKSLRIEIAGSGDVKVAAGTADDAQVEIMGSGDVDCRAAIQRARLSIMGSGDLVIRRPKQVEQSVLGAGEIQFLDD